MSWDDQTIALCVGHSREGDNGAVNLLGETEWYYNNLLAAEIAEELAEMGHCGIVLNYYAGKSYGAAMRAVAADIREIGNVGLAIELHFNAFNGKARGHEWLHWHSSKAGRRAALEFHLAMSRSFPLIPPRGVKARSSGDRGAGFLRQTPCPAVIAEPYFGDNPEDCEILARPEGRSNLAIALALGIDNITAIL